MLVLEVEGIIPIVALTPEPRLENRIDRTPQHLRSQPAEKQNRMDVFLLTPADFGIPDFAVETDLPDEVRFFEAALIEKDNQTQTATFECS